MTETCTRCQQYEAYASEGTVSRGRELTMAGARELVDRLRDTDWWEKNVPGVLFVEIEKSQARYGSVGGWRPELGTGVMEMSPDHLCELFVCHELAHVLAKAQWGASGHDPQWARMYLQLVYLVMGSVAYKALYDAFVRDGIDFA